MSKEHSKFAVRLNHAFQANGFLLTIAAVAIIIFGGVTLIVNPERWWVPALAVAGLFAAIFLLINAAAVVKSIFALFFTLVASAFAFQIALSVEPGTSGAFVWMFITVAVAFGSLAISYLIPSGQSRWSVLVIVQIIFFLGTAFAIESGLTVTLASVAMGATSLVVYFLIYRFGRRSGFNPDRVPQIYVNKQLDGDLTIAAAYSNMDTYPIVSEDETKYLVWDDRAYLIIPVKLEEPFAVGGGKRKQLTYMGKPINPWLRYILFTQVPYRKAAGADIMLVLADMTGKNGNKPKVIGVSTPDSKAVVPVGVFPLKTLPNPDENYLKKAFRSFEGAFSLYADPLTKKQIAALESFGKPRRSGSKDGSTED